MTFLQAAPFLIAFMSAAAGIICVTGAHLAADHNRRRGAVAKGSPDFFVFSKNPAVFGVVPSFRAIYSSAHRIYDSRFISACIHIARAAFLLAVIAFVVGVALSILR